MKKFVSLAAILAITSSASFAGDDVAELKAQLAELKAQVAELKKGQETSDLKALVNQVKELKVRTGGDNVKWDIDYRTSYDQVNYKMEGKPLAQAGMMQSPAMQTVMANHFNNILGGNNYNQAAVAGMLSMPAMQAGMGADSFLGKTPDSTASNGLMTNRLTLGMKAAPTKDLSFIGKLSYNKAFGDTANHAQSNTNPMYANFDWVTNENATDNTVKVKEAYAIYFGDIGAVPYTASIGRRPSYDGLPGNMREGNANANSPLSHIINVEYDGASFLFNLEKLTGISGMSWKLCMGRGLSNARPRFDFFGPDYSKDKDLNPNVDLAGFIFVPFDNGQYSVHSMFFKAKNMIGFTQNDYMNFNVAYMMYKSPFLANALFDATDGTPMNGAGTYSPNGSILANLANAQNNLQFKNVGDLDGGTIVAMANGIGSGWGEFLDNTTAFASFAYSKTHPNENGMLGSTDAKYGSSWWIGAQMPLIVTKEGRLGLEYNKGPKYWRSITHGEDTMIGSKLATRGNVFEAYINQPLLKNLDAQVRYTKINYDYVGSNSFFGYEGTPYSIDEARDTYGMNAVKSSSDIRAYLRYRY